MGGGIASTRSTLSMTYAPVSLDTTMPESAAVRLVVGVAITSTRPHHLLPHPRECIPHGWSEAALLGSREPIEWGFLLGLH